MKDGEDELVIRSDRVVREGRVAPAAIRIAGGKIAEIGPRDAFAGTAGTLFEAGASVVLPGIVDPHVHVNEPGRTEWEGFETATRAAAAGGVTTIVDMPLNSSPVTTTLAALEEKKRAAEGKCRIDHAFWGGVVPGNAGELEALHDAGVRGFKCFLVHSGIDDFPNAGEEDLRAAMPVIARLGSVLLAHAELPGPIERAWRSPELAPLFAPGGPPMRRHADWLASRPRAAENEAIALLVRLAREYGCRTHIVHLSSSDALPLLREARAEGLPITVETCPHYLAFASEEVPDGATQFKCAPPIREAENRERLWGALIEGEIDLVATDHSPCPPEMKRQDTGDFARSWGGISSLELALSVLWTEAASRGVEIERLAGWLGRGPARLAGLGRRKGEIAVGRDADLVVFDPDRRWPVDQRRLRQRHKLTPYAGRTLRGLVEKTFVRGRLVYDGGEFPGEPAGARIEREDR